LLNLRLIDHGVAVDALGLVHRVRDAPGHGPHAAVLMIHGRSGDENSMWAFLPALPKDWLLIAPRGIKQDPDGGYAWHAHKRNEWPALEHFDEAVESVVALIHALPRIYNVDAQHVYLMGFSQGAATAYATAIRHRELVQGIAGLLGYVPTDCDDALNVEPLKGLPVFAAVGRNDPLSPYERSQLCWRLLHEAGALLDYNEYDTEHRLTAEGMRDLKRWWQERTAER